MDTVMKLGTKGQIVIPVEIRRELDLEPGQKVRVRLEDGKIILRPVPNVKELIGSLTGRFKDGPSMTQMLIEEHADEVRRDEELSVRRVRSDGLVAAGAGGEVRRKAG